MAIVNMSDLDLAGKRLLIRQDLNVPIEQQVISSDARIRAALPTLKQALAAGASVLIMSHLGRPNEGQFEQQYSLAPVAQRLTELLGCDVPLLSNWLDGVDLTAGTVALAENVRFLVGEKKNDDALARKMAALCDLYVMDAFATAHRAQASTHGVAKYAPQVCAGPLLAGELDALAKALQNPARPLVAIVGGAKVSTKLTVLQSLTDVVDQLIVGGGIANTFIAASGQSVGQSLCEYALLDEAKNLQQTVTIPLPQDVICAKQFAPTAIAELKAISDIADDDMIFDIGPQTAAHFAKLLKSAATIVWNGPVGVFEFDQFGDGTQTLARAIAQSKAFSIAGGGDTLAAIDKYGISADISYISTGGGAFLEFLEGKTLPAVQILQQRV